MASASASALAIGFAGVVPAYAVNECGVFGAGSTVNCTAPSYPTGIAYVVDNLTLNVGPTVIGTTGTPRVGVGAQNWGAGAGATTTTTVGTVSIVTTGDYGFGISSLTSGSGDAVATTSAGTSIVTNGDGGAAGIRAGATGTGNALGTNNVTTGSGFVGGDPTMPSGNHGLWVSANGGNATARNTGSITTNGTFGWGVFSATSGNGNGPYSTAIYSNTNNVASGGTQFGASIATAEAGSVITTTGSPYGIGIFATVDGWGNATATNNGTFTSSGGQSSGVVARVLYGAGDAWAQNNGSIVTTGPASPGVLAAVDQGADGDSTAVNTGNVATSGDSSSGIHAYSTGGNVFIRNSGNLTATGADSNGILMDDVATGGIYDIDVTGGTVSGGTGIGAGIRVTAVTGDVGTIDISAGATITATSGVAIVEGAGAITITSAGIINGDISTNDGNDTLYLLGGSVMTSSAINMGTGSDIVQVNAGSNITGVELFDGGDDVSIADGWIDSLSFIGQNYATNGANLINWETLTVAGGQLTILDGAITVGSDPGYGLLLTGGASLEALDALAITGNLDIGTGSTFIGTGGGAGVYSVSGNVANAGLINLQDGAVGDVFSVGGNYIGSGGRLLVDTYLGTDGSASDRLIVAGDTSGTTSLVVTNAGGPGAATLSDGILVVQVDGASNGVFQLVGDYVIQGQQAVIGGAFAYTLGKNGVVDPTDGDWYLRSQLQPVTPVDPSVPPVTPGMPVAPPGPLYQPGVPLYESYPQALLALNGLPTLQQRVGNRYWNEPAVASASVISKNGPSKNGGATNASLIEENAFWGRIEGTHTEIESDRSTSATDYSQNIWKLQAGLDGKVLENDSGKLIAGINGQYGRVTQDVTSFYGTGEISTEGYGIGATLTWYGFNGFYVDAQASATWYDSDLDSDWIGQLTDGNDGFGYAFSAEAGKRFDIGAKWTLTPQAQLVYSNVDFDTFTDPYGAIVSLDSADSLIGRLGLAAEYKDTWTSAKGDVRRLAAYGIGNLYYEFLDGTQVDVSQTGFVNEKDAVWGGIGLGGSYNWADDRFSLYGEALVASSLENFGDSYSYGGTIGLRMRW